MTKDMPSTSVHRGPVQPGGGRKGGVLICAFPTPKAVALPDSGTVIGRSWLAERGLADTEVSNAHLRIDRRGGGLHAADAGSRNGTWMNGERLEPNSLVPLEDGAVMRIGRTLLVAREPFDGELEPAPPIGELVGPFGLRAVARALSGLSQSASDNVLVEGETGVGKELVARAVARALGRETPFAAVNVAGVASGVFESQMFGHVAGAFSGAGNASPGIARAHHGGTLFLDEIGELDRELQAKLLRLLENREVLPVGADRPVQVDVLVVAATNRDLEEMVEEGSFRRDLFTRLAKARIALPPLRDRPEDLFSIAQVLAPLAREDVEVEALERLMLEPWPGNVRELAAVLSATRRVDPAPGLRLWALESVLGKARTQKVALTQQTIDAAIAAEGGNVTAAAARLGVSRGKLLRLRKRIKD